MSKQSSRIYGIKVKEHRNYYEYPHSDDPEIDVSEIKIYYDKNAINKWIIKSNYNSIWYNGTAYPVGSIILAFKDGTDCTNKPFMLMAPHEENGIIVNYFYRITGRFSTVPPVEELLIEQEDVPLEPTVDDSDSIRYTIESGHPNAHYDQLYVRKFVNDEEVGHQIVTAESIRAHQVAHSNNYYNYLKVFNALLFDWNGMLPRIEDSYTFTLYSNVTYLEITPTTYQKGWKIKSWNWDTPVNLNILDFSRQPEPAPVDEHDNIKFNIATNENNPDAINIDKVVNNAVVSTKTYSASDVLAYRNSHNNEPIVVYENLLLDFYEETYPGYKFYLRANSNYLKYEDNWIKFGDTITSWGYNDIVNFEINDYSNRYENEIKENTTYNVLVEHIVWRDGYYASVDPSVSLTSDDVCYDIFYDHLEMYYNNHYHKAAWLVYDQPSEGYKRIGKLAIMWAKPFWVLITTADGVRWNGTTYKGRKLLRMWHEDEAVDMTMTREQSRKVIAKGQDYDDILYVITTAESSNDLTVIKRINDLDDDTIVFNPETDCPVDFYNIRFTYSGEKIHVYSKCDFIYLSGSNYKKGRDIIDWPLEEKVNFGIKDETNAYEIINTATYTVKSEEVTVTDYDISTLMDEHWTPLKVCKIVNNKESDDEIIYFYDCSINPFVYDGKLEISYDPASTYWTLTSLSDEIYMDNVQYPEGTVIATWPFGSDEHIYGIGHSDISHYDVRLHSVEVDSSASYETTHEYITDPRYFIVTQSDHSLNLTNDQPGSSPVTRNIRYMDALNWYQFFQIKIKYDVTDSDWIIKSDSNELFIGQDRYKKGEIISKWDYYEDIDSTISVLIEDIKHTTREEKVKDLLVSAKSSWLYGYIWQKEEGPGPTPPSPDYYRYYIVPAFIPSNYRDSGLYGNGYRYIAIIRVEYGHRFVKRVALNGYYNRINANDEFKIVDNETMFTTNAGNGKGMYRYRAWYSNGPINTNNWSFVDGFPNSSGSYVIHYYKSNVKITFTLGTYYTSENGEGWRIVKRTYTDDYLYDYVESTKEIFYQDFVGFPWLNHKTNYFNGEFHGYSTLDGEISYIDKGDYLLLFGNSCLADSRDVAIETRCISAKLYINNLELVSFNNQVPIDLQALRADAISRGLPNNNRTQASLSTAQMTVGKYQLYYVTVSNSDSWMMVEPFQIIYVYKYDIETNTVTLKGSYKIYDVVITDDGIDSNKMYDLPWHIPNVISDGKGYCYHKTADGEKLEVYEINDPYDFEDIYSGGEKVAEYSLDSSISILNLETYQSSQFTYRTLFYDINAYNNSSIVSHCEYYNTLNESFLSNSDKKGVFRYVFNKDTNTDPMIVYFPDPTLEEISGSFFFETSALRYSSEINEEWFTSQN